MMEQKQYELAAQVLREVQKVILGKREIVEKVLMAVLAQGHVLLDDVPGVGKTTLAMAFARALGLETRRVQFTPDTMPSDILGFSVYDKQAGAFSYQPGAVMTNLLLADEINRTSTKTQAALLEAMEERRVTVDGKTHPLPQPFFVLATQNPVGSAGTQLLPPAHLRPVDLHPLQQQLLASQGALQLQLLVLQAGRQFVVAAVGHHVGDLLDAEAEIFKPETVHQEIDVPRLVIAVIVARVLARPDHALLFIIAQQVCGYPQDPRHVPDLVPQPLRLLF